MKDADLNELLDYIAAGEPLIYGERMYEIMHFYSDDARRVQARLNSGFHSPAEIRRLMRELVGGDVPESFKLFPPFYCDFGKNIHLGERVFINFCCCFQDQGGIFIGDDCLIGHRATIATINHGMAVQERNIHYHKPVKLEKGVWLGSSVTVLPGVTIGAGAIVAAGSVVVKDVEPMSVVAGNPARKIKDVPRGRPGSG